MPNRLHTLEWSQSSNPLCSSHRCLALLYSASLVIFSLAMPNISAKAVFS